LLLGDNCYLYAYSSYVKLVSVSKYYYSVHGVGVGVMMNRNDYNNVITSISVGRLWTTGMI